MKPRPPFAELDETVRKPPSVSQALPADHDALDYLQAVYRGEIEADSTRMRAAALAIPYERPKISVTASVNGRGLANAIEAAYAKRIHAPQTQALLAAERDREGVG